jgi:hypothetical protein
MTLHVWPGAAYVKGARLGAGQWVWLTPLEGRWPEGEPPPVVGVGRVAEVFKRQDAARVELLALLEPALGPFAVRAVGRGERPGLQKRLVEVEAGGAVAVGLDAWVTGDEVYGVLPPLGALVPERRVAAQVRGLVTLAPSEGRSEVRPWIGQAPRPGDLLLLLGSRAAPAFEVQVVVARLPEAHPLAGEEETTRAAVAAALTARGLDHVSVRVSEVAWDGRGALAEAYSLRDTALRVLVLGDAFLLPWERLGDEVGEGIYPLAYGAGGEGWASDLGAALAVEVHGLLGQHAAKAFLLESWLSAWLAAQPSAEAWAALCPALTSAYRRMRRDDWALEAWAACEGAAAYFPASARAEGHALRLEAALGLADTARLRATLDALPSVSALLPRLREASLWRLARYHVRQGEPEGARALLPALAALTQGPLPAPADALHGATRQRVERLALELARLEATAPLTLPAAAPGATDWFGLLLDQQRHLADLDADPVGALDALSDFALRAQDAASPGLVYDALLQAALSLQPTHPAVSARLLTYAAWSAQAAARPWTALDALAAAPFDPAAPWPAPLLRWYERALATLDLRAPLAHHTLRLATTLASTLTPGRARPLLELARALFVSIGDASNVAACDYHRARLEASLDQYEAARAALRRGRPFERASPFEALRLFREQVEAQLPPP